MHGVKNELSCYWFDREKILNNARDKYRNEGDKKYCLVFIDNKTFYEKMQEKSIEYGLKKKIKYQRKRNTT